MSLVGTRSSKRMRKNLSSAASLSDTKKKPSLLPNSLPSVVKTLQHLKKNLSSQPYHPDLSLRVQHAAFTLQQEYLSQKSKRSSSVTPAKAAKIREQICSLFAISPNTYSKIMNSGMKGHTTGDRGNFEPKATRVPVNSATVVRIRDFVRQKRESRERVTSVQVMEMLEEEGVLQIPRDEDGGFTRKGMNAAQRAVQRWLSNHGYQRGKRTGNLSLRGAILAARDQYLIKYF